MIISKATIALLVLWFCIISPAVEHDKKSGKPNTLLWVGVGILLILFAR